MNSASSIAQLAAPRAVHRTSVEGLELGAESRAKSSSVFMDGRHKAGHDGFW
jgi:hypothetical protein